MYRRLSHHRLLLRRSACRLDCFELLEDRTLLNAELAVSLLDPTAILREGEQASLRFQITNGGTEAAPAVSLTQWGNEHLEVLSANASTGSCEVSVDLGLVRCDLLELAAASTATVTLDVTGGSAGIGSILSAVSPFPDGLDEDNHLMSTIQVVDAGVSVTDLEVSIAADAASASIGSPLTYSVSVRNAGSEVASQVVLTSSLPAQAELLDAIPSENGNCTVGQLLVTCTLDQLAVGNAESFDISVRPFAAGSLLTNIYASSDSIETNPLDNLGSLIVPVENLSRADLSIAIQSNAATVGAGDPLEYVYSVANQGPDDAAGVSASILLPVSFQVTNIDLDAPGGTAVCEELSPGEGQLQGNPLIPTSGFKILQCQLGDLATLEPSNNAVVRVQGSALLPIELVSGAAVISRAFDEDFSDNSDFVATLVDPSDADLEISQSGPTQSVAPGADYSYEITVSNNGQVVAPSVVVWDLLPLSASLREVRHGTPNRCQTIAQEDEFIVISCFLGAIQPGASKVIDLDVTAPPSDSAAVNLAVVAGLVDDSDLSNNTSAESTLVGNSNFANFDLEVDLQDDVAPGSSSEVGSPVTYTLTVTNLDNQNVAKNVILGDILDPRVQLAPGFEPQFTITSNGQTSAATDCSDALDLLGLDAVISDPRFGSLLVCPVGVFRGFLLNRRLELDPGATATVTFQATATHAGELLNAAFAASVDLKIVGFSLEPELVVEQDMSNNVRALMTSVVAPDGDLTVSVEDNSPLSFGDDGARQPLEYTLTATLAADGTNPASASGVRLFDFLDPRLPDLDLDLNPDVQSPTNPGARCSLDSIQSGAGGLQLVQCSLGTIQRGADESVTLTIGSQLSASGATPLVAVNGAVVLGGVQESDLTNNVDVEFSPLLDGSAGDADLVLAATVPLNAVVGELSYSLSVVNDGGSTATRIHLTDRPPQGSTFVAVNSAEADCANLGAIIECNVNDLAVGESASIDVTVSTSAPGTYSTSSSVSSRVMDPDLVSNQAARVIVVLAGSDTDGIADNREQLASDDGDINDDGTQDSAQHHVAALRSLTSNLGLGVSADPNARLIGVTSLTAPSTAGLIFPYDMVQFAVDLRDLAVGETPIATTLTVHLPDDSTVPVAGGAWMILGPDGLKEFAFDATSGTGAQLRDNNGNGFVEEVVLNFVDGARGDKDGKVNGLIVDPGGLAVADESVDVKLTRFTTGGTGTLHRLVIDYSIGLNDIPPSEIGFFTSKNGRFDIRDVEVADRAPVSQADDRSVGSHRIILDLPSLDQFLTDASNRFLLAVFDPDETIADSDRSDNAINFVGVFHRPASEAPVMVRGFDALGRSAGDPDDVISIKGQGSNTLIRFNGRSIRTPSVDISEIRVLGVGGNDRLTGHGSLAKPLNIDGFSGDDILVGGGSGDRLLGGPGTDLLKGGNGNDFLNGGGGDDNISGQSGNDQMFGSSGKDILLGAGGNDRGNGGGGDDNIKGGPDRDIILGGPGADRLFGQAGNDVLRGGGDDDLIDGGSGRDRVDGQAGNDRLFGGLDRDIVLGGAGNDSLDGAKGKLVDNLFDEILGGAGNDSIVGSRDSEDRLNTLDQRINNAIEKDRRR